MESKESSQNPTTQTEELQLVGTLSEIYMEACKIFNCKPNSKIIELLQTDKFCVNGIIDLYLNFVGNRGIVPLLECIKRIPNCTTLKVCQNGLRNDGAIAICQMARNHPSLKDIDLSFNAISLTAADEILKLVRENQKIVNVNLEGTRIDLKYKLRINKYLEKNQSKSTGEETK